MNKDTIRFPRGSVFVDASPIVVSAEAPTEIPKALSTKALSTNAGSQKEAHHEHQ